MCKFSVGVILYLWISSFIPVWYWEHARDDEDIEVCFDELALPSSNAVERICEILKENVKETILRIFPGQYAYLPGNHIYLDEEFVHVKRVIEGGEGGLKRNELPHGATMRSCLSV